MIQHIPMNVRRINFFSFGNRCNATNPFYSFARLYRLSSRNHFHHRAQRALRAQHLLKQCPTPISNRGRHVRSAGYSYRSSPTPTANRGRHVHSAGHYDRSCPTRTANRGRHVHSAGYYISNTPAESRSAGCGARRKAVRLSGRRHGVAPWASVKLPLRPAFPSKEAQARGCPEASQPSPRPRNPSKARGLPA